MPVQVRPPAFKMKTDLLVIRERFFLNYAGMAELADAPDLGSGVHDVQVQVLLPAVNEFFLFHMFPFSSGDFCSIIIHGTRYSECGLKNNNILCMSEG